MQTLNVVLAERSYPIHIGSGLLDRVELLLPHIPQKRAVIVSNFRVKWIALIVQFLQFGTRIIRLRLKDVPWDQALSIILQSKGLDMRKNGNVIQVAPREEIASKEKIELAARQEISELEVVRTESFQLSFAKAADMASLLKNKDAALLSKRGSAVSDLRTNTLFVQDTPTRLEEVRGFVKQLDVPVRQVLIEARFVEAGETFNRTLGGRLS